METQLVTDLKAGIVNLPQPHCDIGLAIDS